MKTLIVVDMQSDFIDGALGSDRAKAIVPNVIKKIQEYNKRDDKIIFTQDTHYSNYLDTVEGKHLPVKHCIKYTHGWEIPREIDLKKCEHIYKETFGYINWKNSHLFKDGVELIGLCTSICVLSNAILIKNLYPDIEVTVDASCCACVTEETHKAGLLAMKTAHINIINDAD